MEKDLEAWKASLSEKERKLHELASIMLKKSLITNDSKVDKDNGSYFPDKCHAFRAWLKGNKTNG
jgi:hypothetical protein